MSVTAFDPNAASVHLDQLFTDVQTQPQAFATCVQSVWRLIETVKNLRQTLRRDTASGVAHVDAKESRLAILAGAY